LSAIKFKSINKTSFFLKVSISAIISLIGLFKNVGYKAFPTQNEQSKEQPLVASMLFIETYLSFSEVPFLVILNFLDYFPSGHKISLNCYFSHPTLCPEEAIQHCDSVKIELTL